jgi:hypothetical protein
MAIGCALFSFSMAGWMLPLGILRAVTPAAQALLVRAPATTTR